MIAMFRMSARFRGSMIFRRGVQVARIRSNRGRGRKGGPHYSVSVLAEGERSGASRLVCTPAHRGEDGDLSVGRQLRAEAPGVTDALVAHEEVDVRSDVPLLVQDPVPEPGVDR